MNLKSADIKEKKIWWSIVEKIGYDADKGRLNFLGIPYTFIPASIIPKLHKRLGELIGPAVKSIIYDGAFDQAYKVVDKALKKNVLGFLLSRLGIARIKLGRKVIDIVAGEGWGVGELIGEADLKKGEILKGRIHNSFEARFYGKSKEPVCSFLMGSLAGGASAIWREEAFVRETKCIATGDKFCAFEVKLKRFLIP